jgi:hypothetical protein
MNQDDNIEMLAAITRSQKIKNDIIGKESCGPGKEKKNPVRGSKCFVKIDGFGVKSTSQKKNINDQWESIIQRFPLINQYIYFFPCNSNSTLPSGHPKLTVHRTLV